MGMGKYIRPFVIFLLLLCIVAACDGNGNNNVSTRTIGPEGGTVKSSDGKLTLEIPPGALTEDTEITIRKLNPEDLGPEFEGIDPELAYELEPDGLQFMLPVTARVEIDIETTQDGNLISADLPSFNLINRSGNIVEVLENQILNTDLDTKTSTITGELSHFSILAITQNIPDPSNLLVGSPRIILKFAELPCKVDINIPFIFSGLFTIEIGNLANLGRILFNLNSDFSINDFSDEAFSSQETERTGIASGGFLFFKSYTCLETGTHKFKLRVSQPYEVEVAPGDFGIFLFEHEIEKEITCVEPGTDSPPPPPLQPTEPPPTEPPVEPALEAIDIDGSWNHDCLVLSEAFLLIGPNLGDPFSFQADVIVNPETLETMILPFDEIFELDGFLMQLENGDFSFSGDGTGFLGDTNPAAANIIVKAEDWNYSLNPPGFFGVDNQLRGDNQPGDVFVEGVLRFNFPTFPLNSQSSLAECVGIKAGD